ncbi:hypothetical protein ACUNV4_13035 [Granulosicoccus sp. 3-233]|uniref:hypothetical protein n=1 Tax=Granulosicoccus sp. 3-233 TaxID=3417969 RepID=UPI003D34A8CA
MKFSTSTIAIVLSIPMAVAASVASAQDDPAQLLEMLDTDGNGSLSEAEASANEMIMGKWDTLDADGNSEISAEELAALAAE